MHVTAADAFYSSGNFWAAAAVIVALAAGGGAMWATLRAANPRRSIHVSMHETRLLRSHASLGSTLEIRRNGALLTDPRLVQVYLRNPSRRDIASSAFDQGAPLRVDLGVPILDVLGAESSPTTAQAPPAAASGAELGIGPGRIGRRSQLTYLVLIDGDPTFACRHTLIDVEVTEADLYDPGERAGRIVERAGRIFGMIATIGIVVTFLFMLVVSVAKEIFG
ncbi:hypothetical protein [Streptomyces sp. NPDC001820]|uniref:hypothetical protein n=1 Tax=Streptomyces sp. NPDC001820 TaxID=3364613 RepID=UPI0036C53B3C